MKMTFTMHKNSELGIYLVRKGDFKHALIDLKNKDFKSIFDDVEKEVNSLLEQMEIK
jgi:hypothetical protein